MAATQDAAAARSAKRQWMRDGAARFSLVPLIGLQIPIQLFRRHVAIR